MWGAVMKTTIKRKRKSKNKIENQQKVKNKGKPDYLLNNSVCVRQKFVYKSEICYIYICCTIFHPDLLLISIDIVCVHAHVCVCVCVRVCVCACVCVRVCACVRAVSEREREVCIQNITCTGLFRWTRTRENVLISLPSTCTLH